MHYTYVPLAEVDGRFYIGATRDLKRRVAQHEAGLVPFQLLPPGKRRPIIKLERRVRGIKLERHQPIRRAERILVYPSPPGR